MSVLKFLQRSLESKELFIQTAGLMFGTPIFVTYFGFLAFKNLLVPELVLSGLLFIPLGAFSWAWVMWHFFSARRTNLAERARAQQAVEGDGPACGGSAP